MTRDSRQESNHTDSPLSLPDEEDIINYHDLSKFQDSEKQHILEVLKRGERLYQEHLSRFM